MVDIFIGGSGGCQEKKSPSGNSLTIVEAKKTSKDT